MERDIQKSIPYSKERIGALLTLAGYSSHRPSREGLSFFRRIRPPEKYPRCHINVENWNGDIDVNFHIDGRTHRSVIFSDARQEELKRIISTLSFLPQSPERRFLICEFNGESLFGMSKRVKYLEQRAGGRRIDYKEIRDRQKGKKPERLEDSEYPETLD